MSDKKIDVKIPRSYAQDSFDGMPAIDPKQQQQQPRETGKGGSSEVEQTPPDPDEK
jgi:hypothetical protein